MGISGSKLGQELPEEELSQGSVPSTPILTSKIEKQTDFEDLDPRSPSANICRTPIQMVLDEHYEDCRSETPEKVFLDIDPRSPTVEFNRTPIVVAATEEDLLKKLHKKNLQNTPKLLESSPITPKSNAMKRRSTVGVLETNIDFVETDLDVILSQKCKSLNRIDLLKKDDVDPRSPTVDFIRTPVQVIKKIEEIEQYESVLENLNEEIKDTEIVEETKEVVEETKGIVEETEEIIKETKPIEAINITADIKDFNKKLTNLIYEDKNVIIVPRVVKLRENNRTPLGNRNSTGEVTKSMLKLKVSDKPRKSEGSNRNSKIPVFGGKQGKKLVQCENTPPRNMEKRIVRAKKTHWDEEASLII